MSEGVLEVKVRKEYENRGGGGGGNIITGEQDEMIGEMSAGFVY